MIQRRNTIQKELCREVFDIDMDVLQDLTKQIRNTHGIQFLDYDTLFKGVCQKCQ